MAQSLVQSPAVSGTPLARIVGVLLALPAVALLIAQYVVPSVQALILSTQDVTIIGSPGEARSVGLENYARLGDLPQWVVWGLVLTVPAAVVSWLGGVGLALTARGGPRVALVGRVVTGLTLAVFTPVGVGFSLLTAFADLTGPTLTAAVAFLAAAPALVGVQATVFAAVYRHHDDPRRTIRVITVVGACITVAVALQAFTVALLTNRAGGNRSTLMGATFITGLLEGRLGVAAAGAVVGLVGAGVLGVVATVVVLVSGLRLAGASPRPGAVLSGRDGLGVAVVVVALAVTSILPYLMQVTRGSDPADLPRGAGPGNLIWMWGPPLVGSLVAVGVAVLAGFGLGWLRPLGRHSSWALLVFAPWVLVGTSTLLVPRFLALRQLGLLKTLVPAFGATTLSIPALMVLTLLFAGLRDQRDAAVVAGVPRPTGAIRPVLGVGLLLLGIQWLITAYDIGWQYTTTGLDEVERWPGTLVALIVGDGMGRPTVNGFAVMEPVWLLAVLVIGSAVLQAALFGRLTVGRSTVTERSGQAQT